MHFKNINVPHWAHALYIIILKTFTLLIYCISLLEQYQWCNNVTEITPSGYILGCTTYPIIRLSVASLILLLCNDNMSPSARLARCTDLLALHWP